ncbi:MAG: hypothetical protein R2865_11345 [Deinococcales bacterium]
MAAIKALPSMTPKKFSDSRLSLYLAIGIAQSFHEASIKVTLKWPNDIYYNEKKLGVFCANTIMPT